MVESLLDDVREHIAESSKHIDHAKEVVIDAGDDVMAQSKPSLHKGRHLVLALTFDPRRVVKDRPFTAMTGAVVIGMVLGFLVGWVLASRE